MTAPSAPFYARAERERGRLRMTKTTLTERSGIGRVTYDRLETQTGHARPATIRAIADVLGIDAEEAYDLAGIGTAAPPRRPTTSRLPAASSVEEALVAALRQRLPDVEGATIARVLSTTADLLQSSADLLHDQEGRTS
jgi:transcriptional regulator with XRE-family HTH domain